MPLTLNSEQLWEKIKNKDGTTFHSIERKVKYKIVGVTPEGLNLQDVNKRKIRWVPRHAITRCYEFVCRQGKCTRQDWEEGRIGGRNLAPIIALLPHAVPEEIRPFTQDEGEALFGVRLRGIRKVDC